jgi:hypothetical protein
VFLLWSESRPTVCWVILLTVLQDAPQRARRATTTLRELHEGEAQHALEADNVDDSMDEEVACEMDAEMDEVGTYTEVADQPDPHHYQVDVVLEAVGMEEDIRFPGNKNDGGRMPAAVERDEPLSLGCKAPTASVVSAGVAGKEGFPSVASSELAAMQLESASERQGSTHIAHEPSNHEIRKPEATRHRTYFFSMLLEFSLDGRVPMVLDIIIRATGQLL